MADQTLDITLKDLLYIVLRTTWSLRHRDRDEVLQSLCNYLEEKMDISHADLRTIMSEMDMTIREYCEECNEVIENAGICQTCEDSHPYVRYCTTCNVKLDVLPGNIFEKNVNYYCKDH